jgi:penicillin-binding protein 1C
VIRRSWRAFVSAFRSVGRDRRRRRIALTVVASPFALLMLLALARSGLEAPAPTLLVTDRAGRFLGELPAPGDERLGFWPVEEVPPRVAAATIAIEDRRFRAHPGVDPLAIARAVRQNFASGRRVSGASTLAMQVARMQRPGARGWLRKALEGATAMALTLRHGRDGVLRHYLRIVPYGHRIHGIGYAARRYLDKPVDDLSWAEVAFLAAIPQSPARMDPYDPRGRVRAIARAGQILDRLSERGEIGPVELAAARAELATLRLPWRAARPEAALHPLLAIDRRLPPGRRESAPRVATTLDLELQQEVQWLAWKAVAEAADRGAGNAAVMVVERDGWKVAAAVGSTGYFDSGRAGAIDFLAEPRSSGSTLKPFLYALALERGEIAPTTILDDLGPGPGSIVNADGRYLGPMLPRAALANSRNVPAVELLARLGLDPFYAALGELGLHAQERPSIDYGLGLAIGSLPVTLERLVGAYTALAGDGRRFEPAWLEAEAAAERGRFVSEGTARRLTQFLADPQARLPSFPRLGFSEYPFPVAVKTGTSSRFRDAWTVAWSERYLVGVWVGHPDARAMSRLTGYRIAAKLARSVLEHLHADELDGLAAAPFPPPRGARAERVCALSGARATAACDRPAIEWLDAGEELPECGVHRLLAFDRRTGRPATGATPASAVEARAVVDLPARYAGWLERQRMTALPAGPEAPLATAALGEPVIEIVSPEPGTRLFLDPEVPAARNTLALAAVVEPAIEQLVWYVDGVPFATVDRPYRARWPLAPGEHVVQARAPFSNARSRAVRIVVE